MNPPVDRPGVPGEPDPSAYRQLSEQIAALWQNDALRRDAVDDLLQTNSDPVFQAAVYASALGSAEDPETQQALAAHLQSRLRDAVPEDEEPSFQISNLEDFVDENSRLLDNPAALAERNRQLIEHLDAQWSRGAPKDKAVWLAWFCFASAQSPGVAIGSDRLAELFGTVNRSASA